MEFVAAIPTVIFTVAFVALGYTFCVLTGKFRFRAGSEVVFAVLALVTTVAAVVIMIAFPRSVDAPAVGALELALFAWFSG